MTQEDKELIHRDLCARLSYGVKGNYQNSDDELLRKVTIMYRYLEPGGMVMTGDIKPYLFLISSMTEKQREEERHLKEELYSFDADGNVFTLQDFYYKNHIDFRGLIPMDLAIDATGLNIY